MILEVVLSVLFVVLFCAVFFKTFQVLFRLVFVLAVAAFATFVVIVMVKGGVWHPLIRVFLVLELIGIAV